MTLFPRMKKLPTIIAILIAAPVTGEPVTVDFTATVYTVVGTPFGIDPTFGTEVTGSFTYETTTPDSNGDPALGDYPHELGGAFSAVVQGHGMTIIGSATPYAQVENLTPDTFRFVDGPRPVGLYGGVMSANGVLDSTIRLFIAITDGAGTSFSGP